MFDVFYVLCWIHLKLIWNYSMLFFMCGWPHDTVSPNVYAHFTFLLCYLSKFWWKNLMQCLDWREYIGLSWFISANVVLQIRVRLKYLPQQMWRFHFEVVKNHIKFVLVTITVTSFCLHLTGSKNMGLPTFKENARRQ